MHRYKWGGWSQTPPRGLGLPQRVLCVVTEGVRIRWEVCLDPRTYKLPCRIANTTTITSRPLPQPQNSIAFARKGGTPRRQFLRRHHEFRDEACDKDCALLQSHIGNLSPEAGLLRALLISHSSPYRLFSQVYPYGDPFRPGRQITPTLAARISKNFSLCTEVYDLRLTKDCNNRSKTL